ncbi:MAG: hypothetical protein ACJ8EI_08465 [Sphingomicrobium sp.]
MRTPLLVLAGAAVVLSAAPADARRHSKAMVCTKYRHGRCVAAHRVRPAMVRHASRYRVGYRFGPSYDYTAYSALPRTYVTRYHLSPDYRYVYNNDYIYVVDPRTYAVERVIYALTH